ncbi:MAG: hypothetical protein HRU20_21615 [Pseudomonadales bacterium]|nr:hypothetical protein [Pseudomonadales bacterium]
MNAENLQPFFSGLTNKGRLQICLLCLPDVNFKKLGLMTVSELRSRMGQLPETERLYIIDAYPSDSDDRAFDTRSGRTYSEKYYRERLIGAIEGAGFVYNGLNDFVETHIK